MFVEGLESSMNPTLSEVSYGMELVAAIPEAIIQNGPPIPSHGCNHYEHLIQMPEVDTQVNDEHGHVKTRTKPAYWGTKLSQSML